jgi:tetratricopeptide (TPR) repeat protein
MTTQDAPKTVAGPQAQPRSFASGRYVVRRLLGEGGQKTVFLAHDSQLDRDVAIAVLKTEGLEALGLTRVQREAQAMAKLGAQPHIVTIFDIGEEDARPFIVCEFVSGGDLHRALREAGGSFPVERSLSVASDLARALTATHEHGILHRDIKPANIWLTETGTAKLGDFGLAMSSGRSRVTQAGVIMGTAAYMAPEQALGGDVDFRGDLYSLGCVIYEMMTGRPPFLGDDTIAVVSQHINTAPVAPSWHRKEVPQALERLTLRLLAKDPVERPQTAAEVAEALEAISRTPEEIVTRDEANPLERLAGGVFVGREQEQETLRNAFDESLSGRGRLILLAGEPGIGKTRLAEELVTYARMRGAQVLWGRCYEGEGAPAYWPWVQAIRSHVYERPTETLLSELGTGAADIAQIVSDLRERLPDLPPPPPLEPEQARFRLFESITTFLRNASRSQPLTLVLDDLHWADKPSLLLLQFVAQELRDMRLLVVGGYRDAELGRQHPLSHTLAELAREQLSQRIVLHGLDERDVSRFVEMTAGIEPAAGLVSTVYKETEGNPFFVKEVVSLLASEGRLDRTQTTSWTVTIPESVRDVVGRRLDRLSEECNRVLTIASVIGREFHLDVLERVAGVEGDALLELLESALAARVIGEVPRNIGSYTFAHAVIRETLYDEPTATRRVRLHRQIAEALEQRYGDKAESHLGELAYHFGEAARGGGDIEKAVDYTLRAGQHAMDVHAWEDAAAYFERALELLELATSPEEATRCDLLLELGRAQDASGDAAGARETMLRAARLAQQIHSAERLARAALGYVGRMIGIVEIGKPDETLIALLEEALDGLGEENGALRTTVMGRLAMELYFVPNSAARRDTLSREAIDAARRLGDSGVLIQTLRARHMAMWSPENLDDRLEITSEFTQLIGNRAESVAAYSAISLRGNDALECGDMETARRDFDAFWSEATRKRRPDLMWTALMYRAMLATFSGRYEEADELAQEALAIGRGPFPRTSAAAFALQLGGIRREQARLHELEGALIALAEQYPAIPAFRWALPMLYSECGREHDGVAEFERTAQQGFADIPKDTTWYATLYILTDACANLRLTPHSATLYAMLLPYAKRNCVTYGMACWGSTERSLGRLAWLAGKWPEAEAHFEAALEWHRRIETPPWTARTQMNYAEMLLARDHSGDRQRALSLLDDALETSTAIGQTQVFNYCTEMRPQAE